MEQELYAKIACVCGHVNLVPATGKRKDRVECGVCHARLSTENLPDGDMRPWAQVMENRLPDVKQEPEIKDWFWRKRK